jgi:hypothetical protein
MCHPGRAHVPRSTGWACSAGSEMVRYAASRVVLPLIVRVRVIRTAAGLLTTVTSLAGLNPDRDLSPGQALELGEQGGLVTLDRDHQMPAVRGEQFGVPGLGVPICAYVKPCGLVCSRQCGKWPERTRGRLAVAEESAGAE